MKTIEEISKDEIPAEDVKWSLDSAVQTLGMFTDNADSSIEQIVSNVKDSTDVAVQESTSNFDDFVRDLMEILENVHLALRKLTLSKSQDLYKELEAITESISSQSYELNEIERERGQNMSQLALSWVLRDRRVTSVIIGASKVSQIDDAVGIVDHLNFSEEHLEKIEAILRG